MSCRKGEAKRSRPQKFQNKTAYRNNLHDNSKKTKKIIATEVAEVCRRCRDIIEWKIKYKKYKPLTQPKTCTKCHQKTIKDAYHIICIACASKLEVCCKCGQKEEIVQHKSPTEVERMRQEAELQRELESLSERKRRAYYRYIAKLTGKGKKKKKQQQQEGGDEEGEHSDGDLEMLKKEGEKEEVEISMEEYFKNAREKIEQLKASMDNCDFLDDFDDLGLDDDDDDYEDLDSDDDE